MYFVFGIDAASSAKQVSMFHRSARLDSGTITIKYIFPQQMDNLLKLLISKTLDENSNA